MDAVRGMILQLTPATNSGSNSSNVATTGVLTSAQNPTQGAVGGPSLNQATLSTNENTTSKGTTSSTNNNPTS